jgi:hypothetical protein
VRGDPSKPCATFDRAYQIARCGDIVEIASGSYPEQTIHKRTTCASPISLRAAAGVYTPRVRFGSCVGCFSNDSPDDLVLQGIKTDGIVMWGASQNVTLDHIDGGAFFIRGPINVKVLSSDWGPCPSPAASSHTPGVDQCLGYDDIQQSRIATNPEGPTPYITRNILIEGNAFHDHTRSVPDHWECLWTNGGTDVVFRGNRIYNCDTVGIWFDRGAAIGANLDGTWLFENNWFGYVPSGTGIGFSGLPYKGTINIMFNSFAPDTTIVDQGPPSTDGASGRINVFRNIIGKSTYFGGLSGLVCVHGANYSANLFQTSKGCGPTDRTRVFGYTYNGERLLPDARAAKSVAAAFAELAAGELRSLRLIARKLSRERELAPPGGWRAKTLRSVISDNVYLGHRLGIQGLHPRLVTLPRWRSAQRALAKTKP